MKNNSVVADIVANQRKLERKRWFVILSFLVIGVVSLILDVMTGPAMLSVSEVVNALFGIGEVDKMTDNIVHNLRLPMALMALVVGATLAVGGAEIQTLLNNPMASPYTLGLAAAGRFWCLYSDCFRKLWFTRTSCRANWCVCHDYARLWNSFLVRV